MFKRFFNGEAKTISSAALIIGAASLTSRVLGIFRDRVLAGTFGAGETLDIYYAAFRIPDLIFQLVVIGTLSAGFIPLFTEKLKHKPDSVASGFEEEKDAWMFVNNILNILFIVLLIVFSILYFFLPAIVRIITPGFSEIQLQETIELTKIMFFSPIILLISGIIGGVLQSYKRFFVYSLAPIFYNMGIIVGALFFSQWIGILGLAWGVVFGAFAHMAIQMPTAFILGYRYRFYINFRDSSLYQIVTLMIPRFVSLALGQIHFLLITIFGSLLAEGTISIFHLANNIQSFPLGIFGISYAIAAFPTLAELARNTEKFKESLSRTIKQVLFFILPSTALFIVLRAQIVRVAFGAGNFDWEDTILTMNTLAFFSLSLFAQSLIPLFSRAFFALKDSVTPFIGGLISTFANVILSYYFAQRYGVEGLALAFSISSVLNLIILWVLLRKKMHTLNESSIFISILKILCATFLAVLVTQMTKYIAQPVFGTSTFLGIFMQGASAGVAGIIVYVLVCMNLKLEEAQVLVKSLKKKFFSRFTPSEVISE